MKNISLAVLAACVLTFGCLTAQAQWTNCSGNSVGNDCLGYAVLSTNSGSYNSVFGNYSMHYNYTGYNNTAIGVYALYDNYSGNLNTALGYSTLYDNYSGSNNTAVGYQSLFYNSSGDENVAIGDSALWNSTTGGYNIGIGYQAGINNPAGPATTLILAAQAIRVIATLSASAILAPKHPSLALESTVLTSAVPRST